MYNCCINCLILVSNEKFKNFSDIKNYIYIV